MKQENKLSQDIIEFKRICKRLENISNNISDRNIMLIEDYSRTYGRVNFNRVLTKLLVTCRYKLDN